MGKKILVTGSLGYIGSVLTHYLLNHGFDCLGYDTGFFQDCLLYENLDSPTVTGDMRDFDPALLEGVFAVIHLAGISNDPFGDLMPGEVYDFSREYSLKLARLCKERNVRFVFASSCSVYGKGTHKFLTEDSETFPQTPYSLNKLQIEEDLRGIADENFMPVILRFATAFGLSPRMRFDIVINMLAGMAFTSRKIILNSDGKAWRPYVHVKDICKAIRYCLELEDMNEPLLLNVGDTSQNFQISEVAKMVKESIPGCQITYLSKRENFTKEDDLIRDRKVQDGVDTRTYKISFERVREKLPGFECESTVLESIKTMIEGFIRIGLTREIFSHFDFYRLQKMENLFESEQLTRELFWKEVVV